VLLVPAHTAPNKAAARDDGRTGGREPGPEHRLAMCRLALARGEGLSVCPVEIERGGVSYTVDTLSELHASHPQAELTLIVGADVASTLGSWRDPARVLELARIAVAARPGAALPALPAPARASLLEMPAIDISSSLVRERVARAQAVDDLVGADVARYIAEHGFYRALDAAAVRA
jgi:nicotinate-nucleotide adenylyltransferase